MIGTFFVKGGTAHLFLWCLIRRPFGLVCILGDACIYYTGDYDGGDGGCDGGQSS